MMFLAGRPDPFLPSLARVDQHPAHVMPQRYDLAWMVGFLAVIAIAFVSFVLAAAAAVSVVVVVVVIVIVIVVVVVVVVVHLAWV